MADFEILALYAARTAVIELKERPQVSRTNTDTLVKEKKNEVRSITEDDYG